MRKWIEALLIYLARNNYAWKLLRPLVTIGIVLHNAREKHIVEKAAEPLFLPDTLEVHQGPFKGMRYPNANSIGSALYPKMLGSYEHELAIAIEKAIYKSYDTIIDVGCAEGYYAVGMALRNTTAKIFAFDTDDEARRLCKMMAELNGVADRVTVRASLTALELSGFSSTEKGLIICDCEGYEKRLFTQQNVAHLQKFDLIIETHDFIDITISTYLKQLFQETHTIKSIFSIDDIQKALTYEYPALAGFDLMNRKRLLAEGRPAIIEWLIVEARNSAVEGRNWPL